MRITILALGTRGDVQPAVALALGLERAGHTVRVVAPPLSQDLVTAHGLDYAPIGDPPKTGAPQISFLETVAFVLRVVYLFVRSLFSRGAPSWPIETPGLDRQMDSTLQASADADVILSPFIMVWAYHVAEKLGIPCYLWDTHPFTPTRVFPSFTFTGLYPWWFGLSDRLPSWFRSGGGFNELTHTWIQRALLHIGMRLTNTWRQEKLKLPALKNAAPLIQFYNQDSVALYCYSPLAVPIPPDWPASHYATGYWFLESGGDWQPPPELLRFLAAGPPPVCIGFSSARDRNPERLTKIVVAALAQSGCRGILLTGRGGLKPIESTSDVYVTEAIPHDWLFPRIAAVVHHGGAGSCGAVLRAGVPSVVVPWWGDMHFWGDCLHKLGVSPPALPKNQLSAEKLAAAIRAAVHDSKIRSRAAEVALEIASEDGVTRAVQIIEKHAKKL